MAPARVRITELRRMKLAGEKIVMLTAYDTPMARLLDGAGVDVVLVGDSLGMVALGHDSTLPVTLDAMVHHTSAVSRGVARALLVADMPFLSYQVELSEAIRNAGRLLREGGAAAVKLEGGGAIAEVVRSLVEIGIPVMGHLGVLPQSVHQLGGYAPPRRGGAGGGRDCCRRTGPGEGRRLRPRARVDPGGARPHHHPAARDSDNRHRGRARLRRPGAGQRRHARFVGPGTAIRQALCRAGATSSGRRHGRSRPMCAGNAFPAPRSPPPAR